MPALEGPSMIIALVHRIKAKRDAKIPTYKIAGIVA